MKQRMLITVGLLLIASFSAQAADDKFLYIMSARAKLLSEPSFTSDSLENISKGQKVESLAKTNNWFKVKYRNKIGWLSRLSVSPHPPMKRVSLLAKGDTSMVNKSRMRSSTVSTTAAVRGLRTDGRSRVSDKNVTDYQALAKMEKRFISNTEIDSFLAGLE